MNITHLDAISPVRLFSWPPSSVSMAAVRTIEQEMTRILPSAGPRNWRGNEVSKCTHFSLLLFFRKQNRNMPGSRNQLLALDLMAIRSRNSAYGILYVYKLTRGFTYRFITYAIAFHIFREIGSLLRPLVDLD
jgi:hypothetical protein